MTKLFFSYLFIALLCSISLQAQDSTKAEQEKGDLVLIIKGFENEEGKALIALANTEENYESKSEAYRSAKIDIKNGEAHFSFKDLPFGEYAIKVFHDEDDDGELDTNFLGMPTEDYGFSNNARGSFGPAGWQDAKFIFDVYVDSTKVQVY
jgi:uncharacterized protein (DUF2141 family)